MNNILFISPNPVWGGSATANIAVAKMLQNNGYHVIVNDEYCVDDEYDQLRIDHTPIHRKRFSDRTLLRKLVDDNEANCIIWSPLAAMYFCQDIMSFKQRGVKQIAIVHSLSLTSNFKGRLIDYIVSLSLAKMSAIVYVSSYTMETWNKFRAIRESNAQKVVIHNFVDISASKTAFHIDRPRIGFVGRLSEEKQPQIFCDLSMQSDYEFCVYGNGPLGQDLKKRYKSIEFKGFCKEINKIYSDIDILVMTSKFENCPMAILEAQAFGIPCIAPNVGGIPELINSGVNGILYEQYTSKAILTAIDEVLSNYLRFAIESLNASETFTPLTAIAKWKKILG